METRDGTETTDTTETEPIANIQQAMKQLGSRSWQVDVIRGVISIAFAAVFILDSKHVVYALLYALGVYLILDGVLGILAIYAYTTRVEHSRRKWLDYLLGGVNIILGVLCFTHTRYIVIFLLYIIGARIVLQGALLIRHALRTSGRQAGVNWIGGAVLIVGGAALLFRPSVIFVFLLVFIPLYALVDGGYTLTRGLLLRFAPQRLQPKPPTGDTVPGDIPANAPPTTRRAIVFVRRSGASGLGHIAWAYEWTNGWFNAGSVENTLGKPIASPAEMGFWTTHTIDPIVVMRDREYPYDEYKVFFVAEPKPKQAWKTVIWESRTPYSALRHNCNDVAYDILRMYGAKELIDPAEEVVPNDWYDTLPGYSYAIPNYPAIPIHLRRMSQRELAVHLINLIIPSPLYGLIPPWRINGRRAWAELTQAWDKMLVDVAAIFRRWRWRARGGNV